jgi:sugar (pentulose or hexulose) kinase
MKTLKKTTNRRNFLLAAGLGGAGAAVAVATGKGKPVLKAAAETAPQPSGYHDSEHIQKYYKTTEV